MATHFVLKNVYAYYAKIASPALKFEKKEDKELPFLNKEYVVDLLLPAKDMAKLRKQYKKDVKAVTETKYLTEKEFKETFKVDPPSDAKYKNEDGEYEILKVRKHASWPDGTPTEKPQVLGCKNKMTVDRDGKKINGDVLIGNGSLVNVQLVERPFKKVKGMSLDLEKIQVLELVEYSTDVTLFESEGDDDFEDDDDSNEDSFDDEGEVEEVEEEEETTSDDDNDEEWEEED